MTYKSSVIQKPLCERELFQVYAGEAFILSKDINTPNPEVYLRLETHAPAWCFLRLSDMKQYRVIILAVVLIAVLV